MIIDLNPYSETELALGDLDCFLFADRVLATGTVVLGDLWKGGLAVVIDQVGWMFIEAMGEKIRGRYGQEE